MCVAAGTATFIAGAKLWYFFLCPGAFHLKIIHHPVDLRRPGSVTFPVENLDLVKCLAAYFCSTVSTLHGRTSEQIIVDGSSFISKNLKNHYPLSEEISLDDFRVLEWDKILFLSAANFAAGCRREKGLSGGHRDDTVDLLASVQPWLRYRLPM